MKTQLKERTIVSTRDFMRQFASIIKKPKSKQYIIMNHGKPVATVIPKQSTDADNWWEGLEQPGPMPTHGIEKKHLTLQQLREKYSFRSKEKNLSQKIDKIVYGVKF